MGIELRLTPYEGRMSLGSSYFWDAPQLPTPDIYPWLVNETGKRYPMQFKPYGLGEWPEGAVRVFYVDVLSEQQLRRINPFEEDDMIQPHLVTFSKGSEREMGFRLLGKPYEEEVEHTFGNDWVLLLQLDTDANNYFDLRFYDMGLLYLMIEEERLKRHDFSHVRAYMTSL